MKSFDAENTEMRYAYDLIARTNKSFFLTGRAGTGKTTFLQNVQKSVDKKFIVLAPSGVAAIHAGGQTIHSFFGLGFGVLGPKDYGTMNENKIALVQDVDTIIIDEVSMVRCDIMDAVDRMLRCCRHSSLPFGGVQMVLVGDIFQLPPVANQADQQTLKLIYGKNAMFFYNAHCIESNPLPKIELRKIYRQTDQHFIEILEHFRTGRVTFSDMSEINKCVLSHGEKVDNDGMRITLTAYRKDASLINVERLRQIDGDEHVFVAEYEGKCDKLREVVEAELVLKEGAQVMFIRNNSFGGWANGTLGRVTSIGDGGIKVTLEDGREAVVGREIWEAYEYDYDPVKKVCEKNLVGRVSQYPLRLAWAITIHKSQSLTFDKVTIDFGRGAFSCGQAYVALSRCRSLEGLRLSRRIDYNSVRVSGDALSFSSSYNDENVISTELTIGEAVSGYERNGDYDGAAHKLFSMCAEEAHRGNLHYAYDLLNRTLSYVADDSCLFGQDWVTIPGYGRDVAILNAAGLLYSGKADEALSLLCTAVSASDTNFNGLYLLARALEIKQDWNRVETLYNQMIAIFQDTVDNGLDSSAFRKFKYRLAVLNESHYGDSGVEIMAKLIAENPYYGKYHEAIFWMLRNHRSELNFISEKSNPIVSSIIDGEISQQDFMASVDRERKADSSAWKAYRRYVSMLRLPAWK